MSNDETVDSLRAKLAQHGIALEVQDNGDWLLTTGQGQQQIVLRPPGCGQAVIDLLSRPEADTPDMVVQAVTPWPLDTPRACALCGAPFQGDAMLNFCSRCR